MKAVVEQGVYAPSMRGLPEKYEGIGVTQKTFESAKEKHQVDREVPTDGGC